MRTRTIVVLILIIAIAVSVTAFYSFKDETPDKYAFIRVAKDSYISRINFDEIHNLTAYYLNKDYLLTAQELKDNAEIVGKEEVNKTFASISGFFISYPIVNDTVIIRFKEQDEMIIVIKNDWDNLDPDYQYFLIDSLNGKSMNGTHNISYLEENPKIIALMYHREGLYDSIFKEAE